MHGTWVGEGRGSLLGQLAHSINNESTALPPACARSFIPSFVSVGVVFMSCLALFYLIFKNALIKIYIYISVTL